MIELVYILHAVAETCGGERDFRKRCVIKFDDLERFVFDVLWQKERIATYSTAWDLKKDVERLAVIDVIKFESGEIIIGDLGEFLKKIAPFELVAKNMTAGNSYLKYVFKRIEDSAREYAKNMAPQSA
jgi:hypothetical protein